MQSRFYLVRLVFVTQLFLLLAIGQGQVGNALLSSSTTTTASISARLLVIPSEAAQQPPPSYYAFAVVSFPVPMFALSMVRSNLISNTSFTETGLLAINQSVLNGTFNCTWYATVVRTSNGIGDNTVFNVVEAATNSRLVPISSTQAVLLIAPSTTTFQSLMYGEFVTVNISMRAACIPSAGLDSNVTWTVTSLPNVLTHNEDLLLVVVMAFGLVAPFGSMHGPRMVAASMTRYCLDLSVVEPPLFVNPRNISVLSSNPALASLVGATASLGGFLVVVMTIHGVVALVVVATLKSQGLPAQRALYLVRFPSLCVVYTMPLIMQVSQTSTRLLTHVPGDSSVWIGVAGTSIGVLLIAGLIVYFLFGWKATYVPSWDHAHHCPPISHDTENVPMTTTTAPAAVSMIAFFLGRGKWEDGDEAHPTDDTAAAPTTTSAAGVVVGAGDFTRATRLLLHPYDDQGSWFAVVDLIVSIVCGILAGFSNGYGACRKQLFALVALFGCYWLVAILRRPFRSGFITVWTVLLSTSELGITVWEVFRDIKRPGMSEVMDGSEDYRDMISHAVVDVGLALVLVACAVEGSIAVNMCFRCVFGQRSDHGRREYRERIAFQKLKKRQEEAAKEKALLRQQEKEGPGPLALVQAELSRLLSSLEHLPSVPSEEEEDSENSFERISELRHESILKCVELLLRLSLAEDSGSSGVVSREDERHLETEIDAAVNAIANSVETFLTTTSGAPSSGLSMISAVGSHCHRVRNAIAMSRRISDRFHSNAVELHDIATKELIVTSSAEDDGVGERGFLSDHHQEVPPMMTRRMSAAAVLSLALRHADENGCDSDGALLDCAFAAPLNLSESHRDPSVVDAPRGEEKQILQYEQPSTSVTGSSFRTTRAVFAQVQAAADDAHFAAPNVSKKSLLL